METDGVSYHGVKYGFIIKTRFKLYPLILSTIFGVGFTWEKPRKEASYLKNEYPLPQKKEYRIGYIHIERRMDNRRHSNTVFGPVHNRSVDASIHSQSPNHWQYFRWWLPGWAFNDKEIRIFSFTIVMKQKITQILY